MSHGTNTGLRSNERARAQLKGVSANWALSMWPETGFVLQGESLYSALEVGLLVSLKAGRGLGGGGACGQGGQDFSSRRSPHLPMGGGARTSTGRLPESEHPPPAAQATPEEIRAAFRRLALQNHPDRNADASATARFQAISEAWEVLRDPALRSEYDKLLLHRLAAEEYLRRFADLVLTAQGLGLPLQGGHEPLAAAQPAAVPLIA